jgi:hypothetical protein
MWAKDLPAAWLPALRTSEVICAIFFAGTRQSRDGYARRPQMTLKYTFLTPDLYSLKASCNAAGFFVVEKQKSHGRKS